MSCRLKDYYKEGVPLEESIRVILGLLDQETDVSKLVLRDYSKQNLIARNLESLGFLKYAHPPSAPEVTVRGGTLVISSRPYIVSRLREKSVVHDIARYVLLRAVRDVDWDCFVQFIAALFVKPYDQLARNKEKREFIRTKYYPHFARTNMLHWYGLHLSIAQETGIDKLMSLQDNIDTALTFADPYSESFNISGFFRRTLGKPSGDNLNAIVNEALSIYKENLLGTSSTGYCETLKTIVEALLLDHGTFENELKLSASIIKVFRKKGIDLIRSNVPALTEGHGLVDCRGTESTSYKIFVMF